MSKLSARNVSYAYPATGQLALDNVSLDLQAGEILVLLGANGAGKSTLLHVLSGLLRPSSGEVLLEQKSIGQLSRRDVAKRVALMPQFESMESELTVRDIVRLGRVPHRGWWMPTTQDDEEIVDNALQSMNLVDFHNRAISRLSGGQWRRVILARALAQQANCLVLDEPITGLDLKYQIEALRLIRSIVKQNHVAAVLSLHDLNLASMFADRIALLLKGCLTAEGSPQSVLTSQNIAMVFEHGCRVINQSESEYPMVFPER
ncbi:MAG: ABC transporter ATP-binding protein [Pirellulales bacterium]